MKINLAKYAGFCFGVKRAMDIVIETAEKNNTKIYTLGPLIHNEQVVAYLENKNVFAIDSIECIPDKSNVIIRTHGVPKRYYEILELKECIIIDATCPFVKKIHNIVHKSYNEGKQVIIVGDANHPEVIGINGWCENSAHIISSVEDFGKINIEKPLCMVVQTTFSLKVWNKIKYS